MTDHTPATAHRDPDDRADGPTEANSDAAFALLAEVWPTVAARVDRSLGRRGARWTERQDIVQEVALRAVSTKVEFKSADDLVGWALTVAHNLWTDDGRRWLRRGGGWVPLVDCDGDEDGSGPRVALPAAGTDVAALVEDRLALDAVLGALRTMSAPEREAVILRVLGYEAHGRRETVRLGVRRHRARQRLRPVLDRATSVLDGVAAAVAIGRRRLRDLVSGLSEWRLCGPWLTEPVAMVGTGLLPLLTGYLLLASPASLPDRPTLATSTIRVVAPPVAAVGTASEPAVPSRPSHARAASGPVRDNDRRDGTSTIAERRIDSPGGDPLVDGRVTEEPGDDPVLCVGNLPVVGARCVFSDDAPSGP